MKMRILSICLALVLIVSVAAFAVTAQTDTNTPAAQIQKGNEVAAAVADPAFEAKFANGGTVTAVCPVCGGEKTWTPIQGKRVWAVTEGAHYYVDASFDFTTDLSNNCDPFYATKNSCLYLNGKNITTTNCGIITALGGATINVMGSGTLTGGNPVDVNGATVIRSAGLTIAGNATVNLYGGTFVKGADTGKAPVVMMGTGGDGTLNLYADAKLSGGGNVTNDFAGVVHLAHASAKLNMYGGIIENGKSANNNGGNVILDAGAQMAIYAGKVTGGEANTLMSGGNIFINNGTLLLAGGEISNGKAKYGGNVSIGAGRFEMTGGTMTGLTESGEPTIKYATNLYTWGGTCEISGGTLNGGYAHYEGGNVYLAAGKLTVSQNAKLSGGRAINGGNLLVAGGECKLTGGTLTGGNGTTAGGNLCISGGSCQISGATVTEGISGSTGGNIHIKGGSCTFSSGAISKGTATYGGNIYMLAGSFTMTGGTMSGRTTATYTANYGANIHVHGGTCSVSGGTIGDAYAQYYGGGIYVSGTGICTVGGTATIQNTQASVGANLCIAEAGATLNITGGSYAQGNGFNGGDNVAMLAGTVNISGGNFGGGVSNGGSVWCNGATLTISGAPKIGCLIPAAGKTFSVGAMTEGASVGVWADGSILSTNGNLQAYAKYFYGLKAAGDTIVTTAAEGKLSYAPATVSGESWCAVCGAVKTWKPLVLTKSNYVTGADSSHWYVAQSGTVEGSAITASGAAGVALYAVANQNACFHLNNQTLTVTGGTVFRALSNTTINIFGSGKIVAAGQRYRGSIIHIPDTDTGAKFNLYGGTFERATGANSASPIAMLYAGELNIYDGAVLDGKDVAAVETPAAIYLVGGTANMYGGVIRNGKSGDFGNVYVNGSSVFTMYDGTVTKGVATNNGNAGNFLVMNGGTLNLHGGKVSDGSIGVYTANDRINLYGGTVENGLISISYGANLKVDAGFDGAAAINFTAAQAYGAEIPAEVTGSFPGQLTLVWNAGGNPNLYENDGKLAVAKAMVVAKTQSRWAKDGTAAVAAAAAGEYVKLMADDAIVLTKDAVIDFHGVKATVSGEGFRLYGMDSTATLTAAGTAQARVTGATVTRDVENRNGRFIALTDAEGVTTFHRLDIQIISVSLRTTHCGLYYTAKYECDPVLAANVKQFGVVFSVNNLPGADFLAEANGDVNVYTILTTAFIGNNTAHSGAVNNIMKDALGDDENDARSEMKIFANAYVMLEGDVVLMGDNENAGTQDGVNYSMKSVVGIIDENYADYTEKHDIIEQFCQLWQTVMSKWGLVNIGKTAN